MPAETQDTPLTNSPPLYFLQKYTYQSDNPSQRPP